MCWRGCSARQGKSALAAAKNRRDGARTAAAVDDRDDPNRRSRWSVSDQIVSHANKSKRPIGKVWAQVPLLRRFCEGPEPEKQFIDDAGGGIDVGLGDVIPDLIQIFERFGMKIVRRQAKSGAVGPLTLVAEMQFGLRR